MGLATHLQFPVQKEEEPEEEAVTTVVGSTEPVKCPPQLPPRNSKEIQGGDSRGSELACSSLGDTYLQRLQHIDMSNLPEEHQKSIEEYFHTSVSLDAEQVQSGNPSLPHLKKLTMGICKQLNRYAVL
ncbi:unnamed protein product [Oncorhynchus mykiss]|uniref:Uncharacterized protein n=1 Tax=Oncorhynchus mykiss TaxID=8022 RepID=A0A061ACU5_ONCMY|nr:unnamed protein product [Oncorhynchus mykiss]